jgi:hypothetical protein
MQDDQIRSVIYEGITMDLVVRGAQPRGSSDGLVFGPEPPKPEADRNITKKPNTISVFCNDLLIVFIPYKPP